MQICNRIIEMVDMSAYRQIRSLTTLINGFRFRTLYDFCIFSPLLPRLRLWDNGTMIMGQMWEQHWGHWKNLWMFDSSMFFLVRRCSSREWSWLHKHDCLPLQILVLKEQMFGSLALQMLQFRNDCFGVVFDKTWS